MQIYATASFVTSDEENHDDGYYLMQLQVIKRRLLHRSGEDLEQIPSCWNHPGNPSSSAKAEEPQYPRHTMDGPRARTMTEREEVVPLNGIGTSRRRVVRLTNK